MSHLDVLLAFLFSSYKTCHASVVIFELFFFFSVYSFIFCCAGPASLLTCILPAASFLCRPAPPLRPLPSHPILSSSFFLLHSCCIAPFGYYIFSHSLVLFLSLDISILRSLFTCFGSCCRPPARLFIIFFFFSNFRLTTAFPSIFFPFLPSSSSARCRPSNIFSTITRMNIIQLHTVSPPPLSFSSSYPKPFPILH